MKFAEPDAQLLLTIATLDMAETQGRAQNVHAECWDSGKDFNQGMNLIMELFERGLGSMRAVAVGTEARDHNDVTHPERPLTCLDHTASTASPLTVIWMCADRTGDGCIVVICDVLRANWNNE